MKKIAVFIIVLILLTASGYYVFFRLSKPSNEVASSEGVTDQDNNLDTDENPNYNPSSLSIESLRRGEYQGSDIIIEQTLSPGSNYKRFIASYRSEELKIYGLLTEPNGEKPDTGWPVIVFNHGYIPPDQYRTTERYIAYTDAFSRNGYIVFKPDYRGHGDSEGNTSGGYGSNGYTIDVLNAVSSIKKFSEADPNRIGMWGHSMGGFITIRSMVINKDIKAGVIWAGVVASYPDLLNNWRRRSSISPIGVSSGARRWRDQLTLQFGTPENNPQFWNSISANTFLSDISGPVQLHHGRADSSVPVEFSEKLKDQLEEAGKTVELYTYNGDDHNISNNFSLAMKKSVEFFDKYVKSAYIDTSADKGGDSK